MFEKRTLAIVEIKCNYLADSFGVLLSGPVSEAMSLDMPMHRSFGLEAVAVRAKDLLCPGCIFVPLACQKVSGLDPKLAFFAKLAGPDVGTESL